MVENLDFKLLINGEVTASSKMEELANILASLEEKYYEIWLESSNGSSMMVLTNNEQAWAMFLRQPEDSGYSTRNPNYCGNCDELIDFSLSNGQVDYYPASWVFNKSVIIDALIYFYAYNEKSPNVLWHED